MVNDLGITERVVFEPLLSTSTLQELYRAAKAILILSLLEGFGIPLLEGMASGTPVIASRSSSLPEVGGDAVKYCDPLDENSITAAIVELAGNSDLCEEMSAKGHIQAAKFHPDRVRPKIDAFWRQMYSECATNTNDLSDTTITGGRCAEHCDE
jgi:glycosyltransferase involved in cell wall biosynthesis